MLDTLEGQVSTSYDEVCYSVICAEDEHGKHSASPGAGTVALLFQYAHAAARAGLNVVILGSRESLSDNHPVVDSKAVSDPVWRDVHLKYLSNVQEALLYLGGVHLLDPEFRPHLILLHDAVGLCSGLASDKGGRSREALLCRLFAQFADAATHLRRAGLASAPVPLADALSGSRALLSVLCELENPCVALAQRWLPDCFSARALSEQRGEPSQRRDFSWWAAAFQLAHRGSAAASTERSE